MANTSVALMNDIKQGLELSRPSFEQINLNKLNFTKELEYAIQIFEKNDYLAKTNPQSVKNALVNIALSGLTLNPVMKMAYLVPRKGVCCVDPSYIGLTKILTDTGSVKNIRSSVVYEKDLFDFDLGSNGYLTHKPYLGADARGRKVGAYSLAVLPDNSTHVEFMRWDEIMAIKARSDAVKGGKGSPWDTDEDEMAKKTVIKRHFKYLPKTERAEMAANAIDFDNQTNGIDFDAEQRAMSGVITSETLDTEFEDLSDLPDALVEFINKATELKMLKAVYNDPANAQYKELPTFTGLLNKRRAEIELLQAQQSAGTDGNS